MNSIQTRVTNSVHPDSFFAGTAVSTGYIWKNVIIEKRLSVNWLSKLYEGSLLDDVWTVLLSRVY